MRKLLRCYPRSNFKEKRKKGRGQTGPGRLLGRRGRVGCRPPDWPKPAPWLARSGGPPASRPAQAGYLADAVGWASGSLASPGRLPGRGGRVGLRLPGRPRPGHRPVRPGGLPVPRPAQAGLQAGPAAVCLSPFSNGSILEPPI